MALQRPNKRTGSGAQTTAPTYSGNLTSSNIYTPNHNYPMQYQRKSQDRLGVNALPSNQIMADDYRRLMMIKSPSESHHQAKRYTILSDNFSKINVKQAVALQSGLG